MPSLDYTGEAVIHHVVRTDTHIDLSDYVHVRVERINDNQDQRGEVRSFGTDTRKFIKSASPRTRVVELSLSFEKDEVAAKLLAWITDIVYFRDNRGRSIWGAFQSLSQSDDYYYEGRQRNVRVKITEVSASADVS